MEYPEMSDLADRMAEANALRKLTDMFVEPADAKRRVATNRAAKTQDWLAERGAMFDALWALDHLGYELTSQPNPELRWDEPPIQFNANYDELIFSAHPILGKPTPAVIKYLEKLRTAAPETGDLLLGRGVGGVEWARVQFPNGWMLSILRGCKFPSGYHPTSDYETCRFPPGGRRDEPEARDTIEEVQAEIDEVRAMN